MGIKETEARLMADPKTAAEIAGYLRENYEAVALAELRAERQITQEELAGVLGVSQRRVSAIEHSDETVQVSTISNFLEKLGFHLELTARSDTGECYKVRLG